MAGKNLEPSVEKDWNKVLANLIHHMRLPSFPQVLVEGLGVLAHFDTYLLITYKHALKPIVLHSSYCEEDEPIFFRFINKAYLIDPIFNAIEQGLETGIFRLKDLAPDSFEHTKQYKSCYKDFDLNDEIIFLVPLSQEVVLNISLGRTSKLGSISRSELNRLKAVQPVIQALCQQFWQAQSSHFVHDEYSQRSLEHAINTFTSSLLTPREKQITALVLQGYSSKSVASTLEISTGTVKVHRKSIYLKLNISSEAELFSLFITHLSNA